ncbi:MAG: hypothetical protein GX864_04250 [Mollicutes bacterium]|jgi:membrane carboxypeptidase/penicillin-binding protein|nr:hypothetical protein [Mollicutes bacterium]
MKEKLYSEIDLAQKNHDEALITNSRGRLIEQLKQELARTKKDPNVSKDQIDKLKEELKLTVEMHRNQVHERYKEEFLYKTGGIFQQITSLPNGLKLAVDKVKTNLMERKLAQTTKEKFRKTLKTMGSVGLVAAAPVISVGKLAAHYWPLIIAGVINHQGKYLTYDRANKNLNFDSNKLVEDAGKLVGGGVVSGTVGAVEGVFNGVVDQLKGIFDPGIQK